MWVEIRAGVQPRAPVGDPDRNDFRVDVPLVRDVIYIGKRLKR